ncbi:ABC transporter substrate-binding protein [Salibacterium aidingense]|uniref:ABC transporter substrate-binding protein n=1 Tax=Salibacterium aidingense TaxID=384933 RepID=UPI0004292B13|nr:sugar ABC transporter substrate-binding protein [Salibacterium aidingense]
MKKRLFLIFIIALITVLSACSSGNNEARTESGESGGTAEADLDELDGEFDWKRFEGSEINVALNDHPYTEAILERLPEFEEKTGITVNDSVTPEENYFDKLSTNLNAGNGNPDVFMTGAYQIWEYAPSGYIQSLDEFIEDERRTGEEFDQEDYFEGVLNANRWDGVPGNPVGEGDLWALPLGFEYNALSYNKRALEEAGIDEVPETLDELIEVGEQLNGWNGEGSYGIGVRGTRSWATIHPGFMTSFANHGAEDFVVEDDQLKPQLNSPEAVEITDKFAQMIRTAGPSDWTNYTWYQVSSDLGAGKAAITYDANTFSFFNNQEGATAEAGNMALAPPPKTKDGELGSNMWVWSLAMNSTSEKKDAAWLFMQYFSGKEHTKWGAENMDVIEPVRQSAYESDGYQNRIADIDGYKETFETMIDNATIEFTPQPQFFNATTEWAEALQDIVNGDDTQERLDELNDSIENRVSRIR